MLGAILGHKDEPLLGSICAALFFAVTWRALICGVHIDPGGIKVVGFFVTRRLPWADIERFAVLPRGSYPWIAHVIVKGRHRPLPITGIGAGRGEKRRPQVQRRVDELNELRRSGGRRIPTRAREYCSRAISAASNVPRHTRDTAAPRGVVANAKSPAFAGLSKWAV